MGWTPVKDWASEKLTSTDMDTYLSANTDYLKKHIALEAAFEVPISSGALAITQGYHIAKAETGTVDALDSITPPSTPPSDSEGMVVILRAKTSHTITVTNGTGTNGIRLDHDIILDTVYKHLILIYDGAYWNQFKINDAPILAPIVLPTSPSEGQLWYGSVPDKLLYKDASTVKSVAIITTAHSENLKTSNNTEGTTQATDYTKLKEIIINESLYDIRIKFDLKTSNVLGTAYGRIYKNGVAVGTEQTDATGVYQTLAENLTDFVAGDKIQIYAKISNASYIAYVRNFQLFYDIELDVTALSTTNNDP